MEDKRLFDEIFTFDAVFHGRDSLLFEWDKKGRYVASVGASRVVHVFNQRGILISQIVTPSASDCKCLRWSRDGSYLAISQAHSAVIVIWNIKTKKIKQLNGGFKDIHFISWSNVSDHLAVGTHHGFVNIHKIDENYSHEVTGSYQQHRKRVVCSSWHPTDNFLIVSFDDGLVMVLNEHGVELDSFRMKRRPDNIIWCYPEYILLLVGDRTMYVYQNVIAKTKAEVIPLKNKTKTIANNVASSVNSSTSRKKGGENNHIANENILYEVVFRSSYGSYKTIQKYKTISIKYANDNANSDNGNNNNNNNNIASTTANNNNNNNINTVDKKTSSMDSGEKVVDHQIIIGFSEGVISIVSLSNLKKEVMSISLGRDVKFNEMRFDLNNMHMLAASTSNMLFIIDYSNWKIGEIQSQKRVVDNIHRIDWCHDSRIITISTSTGSLQAFRVSPRIENNFLKPDNIVISSLTSFAASKITFKGIFFTLVVNVIVFICVLSMYFAIPIQDMVVILFSRSYAEF